ncbi:hypothetical protein EV702DRAFT_273498 [Suillus placidus]|uniref:NACHT domain-containing protein n=1 Tax=Suillus placidus TaxID=48579 RepID=A0A9P7D3P9_9AGAM|nr:hypothetical protein EV702DRAFT_273498 [Suillus placidus]
MSQELFSSLSQETWEKLSRVAVKGAEYDSPERRPHPKCLQRTRTDLLNHLYASLNNREKSRIIWLHGMAGVGKSAVAFTVAERMRTLSVTDKRLGATFFFSRKHTKRRTTGYFFATLAYQLATNFPSIREDVNRVIREDPALLGPDKSLREQMNALFLRHLRTLRFKLAKSLPVVFVIDAIDECTSETELTDLISLLGEVLHDPNVPAIHILLTSRSESHIREAIQKLDVQLVDEIPGDGTIFSFDGTDVDQDIYVFLEHSFTQLRHRYPGFPQPSGDQLTRLVSRAGRRFIVASTMIEFIVNDNDGYKDPRDRLELMLECTCDFLPGTAVYKLYDLILSTCASPRRAYQYLSTVAALADPLPIAQISKLLGLGQGRDVEAVLVQLRSIMDIPTDNRIPVNFFHSSVCDYASDPSNCGLPEIQIQDITPPHSLLAESSLRLMMRDIPKRTALLDALSELDKQSEAMQFHDPKNFKQSLAFAVQPPEPMRALIGLLWLRGDRGSKLQFWLETLDGRAWLQTQDGKDWLQTQCGYAWLQTQHGSGWLQTQDGLDWLPTRAGRCWLHNGVGRLWLSTEEGLCWLNTPDGREWLQIEDAHSWLQDQAGRNWLQDQGGGDWLQTQGGRVWLQLQGGRDWLQLQDGRVWLQTHSGRVWLYSQGGRKWLMSEDGKNWRQSYDGQEWLQSQGGQEWLQMPSGREWLRSEPGRTWLQSEPGRTWLQTQARPTQLQTQARRNWVQEQKAEALRLFLIDTTSSLSNEGEPNFLRSQGGQEWLQTKDGHSWLQSQDGRDWQSTPEASMWVTTEEFSSTIAAIREYTIIPGLPMLPVFQVIQQFRSLPDFLMFPAFLALKPQDHSTSELPQGRLLPDMEILRAMEAFMAFTQEAREQSQSTSGALNYACQNWAFHLSQAPSLWDDDLNHAFKLFWDRHLLSWLERQWCLKGLQSCLVVLSEGQRLAQAHLQAP